jgi:hypothetical protein
VSVLRCPLCSGLDHTALFGRLVRCKICSLGFLPDGTAMPPLQAYHVHGSVFEFPNWNNWLTRLVRSISTARQQRFHFTPTTVRMFASKDGCQTRSVKTKIPLFRAFMRWSYGSTIRAEIGVWNTDPRTGPDSRLTLGVIAAANARDQVLSLYRDLVDHVAEIIVVLDSTDAAQAASLEHELCAISGRRNATKARVIAHPLSSDFAAQRNRIQAATRTEWVLQLDCDEMLSMGTKSRLSGIIDEAEREKWDCVALTRRNEVDGVVSALYPDVQYRLLRGSVRFTRPVHEYPVIRGRRRSFINLGASLLHTLAPGHSKQRGQFYEGIQDGAGRPHDTALLHRPLGADVRLPD